jgi:hypothetical protein
MQEYLTSPAGRTSAGKRMAMQTIGKTFIITNR